ncbi:hypothetical protein S245_055544, partial [Arachis hypogaea]
METTYILTSAGMYYPFEKITPWSEHYEIKVQVVRLWTLPNVDTDEERRCFLQILLMDEKFNKVQCTVNNNLINHFQSIMKEGNIYSISQFTVVPNIDLVQLTEDSIYLIDVIGFLISVHESSEVKDDNGNMVK